MGCPLASREAMERSVVWPGWHGATSTNARTHIAIQEAVDGKVVKWLEQVAYEHYRD